MNRWVTDATEASFAVEVIERSYKVPVLVDFWAGWCGPCKVLGPLLEESVENRGGEVWLAKVDVEANPALAAKYRVQGVPVVKAFVDGQIKGDFVGLRDRRGIESFIDEMAPSLEERALDRAAGLLEIGREADVHPLVSPLLEHSRYRERAQLLLARAFAAQRDYESAEELLRQVGEENPGNGSIQGMLLKLQLLQGSGGLDERTLEGRVEEAPRDLEARWALAGFRYSNGDVGGALDELLEILMRDRSYRDDAARRVMLAIFEEIGINHEISNQYRRQMQIYL